VYIARILYPVKVLGPGDRIGIWMCGCHHGCRGCSNPELWDFDEKYHVTSAPIMDFISKIAESNRIDGFTISGGEPFLQPDALRELIPFFRRFCSDILVYSGFTYSELKRRYPDILSSITVLIDGKYIESRNRNCFLRGSDNQKIRILDPQMKDFYENYIRGNTNRIQNFRAAQGFVSVGIHQPGYHQDLAENLAGKGIIVD